MSKHILLIHGPNINMLGDRDTGIYGKESFDSINDQIESYAKNLNFSLEIFQSNWEGAIIDKIHESKNFFDGAVINAGALSHYSYSLRDAITCVHYPFIEVHMSNIFSREDFRSKSVISAVCAGHISGFGKTSYFLALTALHDLV